MGPGRERGNLYGSHFGLGTTLSDPTMVGILSYLDWLGSDKRRSLAYQFVLGLPLSNTLLPIALPTLYLWVVDTLALNRGTWVIEAGTKLGYHLWPGLEIEYV